jgi:DtxR family Mn-dependent transcriptional regulator
LTAPQNAVPLTALTAGQQCTVAYIGREDPALLRYLGQLHIRPGTEIAVERVAPYQGPLTLRLGNQSLVIGRAAADTVFVRARIAEEQKPVRTP